MSQPQYTWKTLSEAEAKAILADEDAEELPFRFINEQGRIEIAKILIDHHKYYSQRYRDPADEFLIRNHLQKWIEEAEFQLREGNGARIEIKGWDALSGATSAFELSDDAYSWAIEVRN